MRGPVLVLGAGGFIGSAVFKRLSFRNDVFGTINGMTSWRLGKQSNLIRINLLRELEWVLLSVQPKTIINCAAYGSFPGEKDATRIYRTNTELVYRILHAMDSDAVYLHAGTSSEYGFNSEAPKEYEKLTPNSDYAVSKVGASQLIEYFGSFKRYRCCNLRLYSVYGPSEACTRLMPTLVAEAAKKKLPLFVSPRISRDFVYIDDVVDAFVAMAIALEHNTFIRGEAFNIATGTCTHMHELAKLSKQLFGIDADPEYTLAPRAWDSAGKWFGDPRKVADYWQSKTSLVEGLQKMAEWYNAMSPDEREAYKINTKK